MIPLLVLLLAQLAAAHDMWIEPTAFFPEPGQIVGAHLRVGQGMLGDPIPRDPSLIKQFFLVDPSGGQKPVLGRIGTDPAGFLRLDAPGLHIIGYRSNHSVAEQTAEKFNQYLKEEGLDALAARGVPDAAAPATPVHEVFSRCAKSLLLSGAVNPEQQDRALGFTLELVAERNPYALGAGGELPVRLTYENHPLPGALVVAMNKRNPAEKISARTGDDGRVRLRLDSPGMWLIKAVHVIPARAGLNAEWESFWASLTFEMRTP